MLIINNYFIREISHYTFSWNLNYNINSNIINLEHNAQYSYAMVITYK